MDDMISAVLYLKPICDDDIVTDFVWISSKRQIHKLLEQYKHDDFRTVPELILLKMRNSRYRCRILARCASMVRHHRQSAHQQLGREGEIYGHHRKRFIRSIHDATRARR